MQVSAPSMLLPSNRIQQSLSSCSLHLPCSIHCLDLPVASPTPKAKKQEAEECRRLSIWSSSQQPVINTRRKPKSGFTQLNPYTMKSSNANLQFQLNKIKGWFDSLSIWKPVVESSSVVTKGMLWWVKYWTTQAKLKEFYTSNETAEDRRFFKKGGLG